MTKEDIHINFLQEIIELQGYTKKEIEGITLEHIELTSDYILVKYCEIEIEFLLQEYLNYRDWWISLERERKIKQIFNEE